MLLSLLRSWWRGRAQPAPAQRCEPLRLVLYTRQGCHLCESVWQRLQAEQQRRGFVLEVVDVDRDPELAMRYGEQVPVVTVNGKERFRGAINPVLLARLLRAETGKNELP